ncbi:hypothetical protein GGX14DRAFT_409309, partial [Mycena pura]
MSSTTRGLLREASQLQQGASWHTLSMPGGSPPGARPSQDLQMVEQWDVGGKEWIFALVLDGHSGEINGVAELALERLPAMVKAALSDALTANPLQNDVVDNLLCKAIAKIDNQIADDFLAHRDWTGSEPPIEVKRARSGSTLCLALVDPDRNVHVANLGD